LGLRQIPEILCPGVRISGQPQLSQIRTGGSSSELSVVMRAPVGRLIRILSADPDAYNTRFRRFREAQDENA